MNYIFSTALPRSGTALLSKSLYAGNQVSMAVGPNIEIYRFFRNKLISKYGSPSLKKKIKTNSPLPDYFGNDEGMELLKIMFNSSLKEKFDKKKWSLFLKKSQSKIDHDSADLISSFNKLKGKSYKDIVDNLIKIIKKKRQLKAQFKYETKCYYGFHESWNICSLLPLAKSFPNSKFFIVLRDPRSVYASLSKNAKKRKELKVQLLSFIRHFRKYVILANYYLGLPIFKDRLMLIRYEALVTNPQNYFRKICKFLKIKYHQDMINPKKHYDFVTKKTWIPFSSFNTKFPKLNSKPIHKWKKFLLKQEIKSLEFLCKHEMKALGYKFKYDENKISFKSVMNFIEKDYNIKANWRTDLENFREDENIEFLRYKILKKDIIVNEKVLKKCFLLKNYNLKNLNLKS